MEFKNILRNLREEKYLTQGELAEALNISQKTISNYEVGTREPDNDTLISMSTFFDVSVDYLLGRSNIKKPYSLTAYVKENPDTSKYYSIGSMTKIPVVSKITPQDPLIYEDNIVDYISIPSEELPRGEYFGIRVSGDSMNLSHLIDGCIAIVIKQDILENGEIGIFILDDRDAEIKRYIRNGYTISLMPHSTNPAHLPMIIDMRKTSIKIIGKIIQSIIRY